MVPERESADGTKGMIASGTPPQMPEKEPGSRMVGQTIRMRRIQAGLTLRRCAELMDMTMTTLSAVEQGGMLFTESEFDRFNQVIRDFGSQ